mmetsp:Transcript_2879/g.8947  ORF Transcript_2879/g.8947 Transcript_2879/m.8947 type:complete len:227 (-) Transcript_2879:126-806(-)
MRRWNARRNGFHAMPSSAFDPRSRAYSRCMRRSVSRPPGSARPQRCTQRARARHSRRCATAAVSLGVSTATGASSAKAARGCGRPVAVAVSSRNVPSRSSAGVRSAKTAATTSSNGTMPSRSISSTDGVGKGGAGGVGGDVATAGAAAEGGAWSWRDRERSRRIGPASLGRRAATELRRRICCDPVEAAVSLAGDAGAADAAAAAIRWISSFRSDAARTICRLRPS